MCQNYWPKRTLRHYKRMVQKKSVRCNMAVDGDCRINHMHKQPGKNYASLDQVLLPPPLLVSTYISPKSRSLTIQQYVCLQCKNPSILDIISALHSNGSFFAGQPCHDTLHSFIVGYYSSILRINPGLGYSLGLLVPKGFPKSAIQASFSI